MSGKYGAVQLRPLHWFARNSSCLRCLKNIYKRNFCQSANVITESENEVLLKQQLRITDQDIHENPDINKEYNRDENTETGTENFFAYSDGKKDKETLGLFYLNMISLPEDLKESLSVFYKKYPSKVLTEDGQKLAKYLRNRGRPTERTWKQFNEAKKAANQAAQETPVENKTPEQDLEEISHDLLDQEAEENSLPRDSKSKTKRRPPKESYTMLKYGHRESAAFASSRIPACFGATMRALSEIERREPNFQPKTFLDFGSGTGSAVWAANQIWGSSLREYQCVDISEEANKVCEFLLRGGEDHSQPLKIPGVYFRKFLPLSNKLTYDIVVSAYTLSEMPFKKQRQAAIANLWGKTNDFLVLIEPGNNEGFDVALQARNYITKRDDSVEDVFTAYDGDGDSSADDVEYNFEETVDPGYVYAPCPHDTACPRSEVDTRDHPCNFEQKVELAFSQRNTALKRWGYATERFSYLILRKGERDSTERTMPRVLHPPKLKRRHVICDICSSNGTIERHVLTKSKDRELYKGVRHCLKWGDLMPEMSADKKPMKVIRLENTEN